VKLAILAKELADFCAGMQAWDKKSVIFVWIETK
jgi:hypothetical protein